MARRPSLSPSKLTCYLACPHRYYWTYVDPRGQWFLRGHSYFSFGQSLHRALEAFHSGGDSGIDPAQALMAAYEEKWIESGYGSADEMQAAFGEGKHILERYADQHEAAPARGTVLFVEKSLRKPLGEWDLIGRADRIDQLEDGTICIIDYKSGRHEVTPEHIANDVAMSAYALMVQDLFPGHRIEATILPLRSSEPVTHRFTPEALSEFEFSVLELGDTIRNHYWEELHPKPKRLCATCDFVALCRKDPEYRELAAPGRDA